MSGIKRFARVFSTVQELVQVQDNIEQTINSVFNKEIVNGVMRRDIVLTTGSDNIVSHQLGRNLLGWVVTERGANAVVYKSSTTNPFPDRNIILNCSANVTVNIWFF